MTKDWEDPSKTVRNLHRGIERSKTYTDQGPRPANRRLMKQRAKRAQELEALLDTADWA